jgi:hypothetical protein
MIVANAVSYEYPNLRALSDVSFTIGQGAIAALIGPNGAGKTTLMRCLAALELPYSGVIEIDGIDTAEHPREVHKRIGGRPRGRAGGAGRPDGRHVGHPVPRPASASRHRPGHDPRSDGADSRRAGLGPRS